AKQLGPYTLEQKLGAGGMGVVYQARHALLRRNTAIKLLPSGVADELRFKRFEREVQLTSELSHPNIVAIYDYGRSPEGEFYYAMEHLPGVDLETLVEQQGPLEAARAVPILRQVADALDAAHFRGLIHRDIKPANVILSRFGRRTDVVKVLDFGLVKEVDESSSLTMEKSICGTPAYLAPEALTAPDEVGVSTDIYALGALGFFLVTGTTVFPGRTVAEVCGHHIHTPAPAPSSATEIEVPPDLDAFVLRCLAKKPVDRFPSAAAVRDALESIASPTTWDPDRAREWWDEYEIRRSKAPPATPVSRDTMTIAPRA
ncbi:MAG: serine/threonine protein kinase, partial [Deltaproteobacteria bacterium]|nr:serine/threonine protein kinase [Deltaproteobacteria bacterium]